MIRLASSKRVTRHRRDPLVSLCDIGVLVPWKTADFKPYYTLGIAGVRLRTQLVGKRRFTRESWVREFVDEVQRRRQAIEDERRADPPPPPSPCEHRPGSRDKIELLRQRLESGYGLWHHEDCSLVTWSPSTSGRADQVRYCPKIYSLDGVE